MKGLAVFVFLLLTAAVFGQEAGSDLFQLNDNGLLGLSLVYQGKEYGTGFGLDPVLARVLETNPRSQRLLDTYEFKRLLGNTLFYGGLVAIVASSVRFEPESGSSKSSSTADPQGPPLLFSLGLSSTLGSFFAFNAGQDDLRNATQVYNFDRLPTTVTTTATEPKPEAAPVLAPSEITIVEDWWPTTFKLRYRAQSFGTAFGLEGPLAGVLSADPDLRALVARYDGTRSWGWGLFGMGAGAYLGGALAGVVSLLFTWDPNSTPVRVSLGISGAGILVAGLSSFVLGTAGSQLREIVTDYNAEIR